MPTPHTWKLKLGKHTHTHTHRQKAKLPLLGRDNRFFANLAGAEDLSFGLLWDLDPITCRDLSCSTTFSGDNLIFGLAGRVLDASNTIVGLLGEHSQPSDWDDGAIFGLERFRWRFDPLSFLPVDLNWLILVPFIFSEDSSSCTITPSLRLMSRKRFSHGRTAIHLSNQFQPQLLLSGSNPEGVCTCLDPACHFKNRRNYLVNESISIWLSSPTRVTRDIEESIQVVSS